MGQGARLVDGGAECAQTRRGAGALCAAARLCLTRLKTERPRNRREAALDAGFIVNTFPINRHSRASIGVALLALLLVAACSTPPGPPTLLSAPAQPGRAVDSGSDARRARLPSLRWSSGFRGCGADSMRRRRRACSSPRSAATRWAGARTAPSPPPLCKRRAHLTAPASLRPLAAWEGAHGLVASGALDAAALQTFKGIWQERRPFVMLRLADVCPPPPADSRSRNAGAAGDCRRRQAGAASQNHGGGAAAHGGGGAGGGAGADGRSPVAHRLLRVSQPGLRRRPLRQREQLPGPGARQLFGAPHRSRRRSRCGVRARLSAGRLGGFQPPRPDERPRLSLAGQRNAGRFGFVNYAFEPWHWEWTGEAP